MAPGIITSVCPLTAFLSLCSGHCVESTRGVCTGSECCGGGGSQNACPCPEECAPGQTMEHTMLQVKADFAARKIPIAYFMFDSWWYPKAGDPGANSSKPWPIRDGNGMLTWTP